MMAARARGGTAAAAAHTQAKEAAKSCAHARHRWCCVVCVVLASVDVRAALVFALALRGLGGKTQSSATPMILSLISLPRVSLKALTAKHKTTKVPLCF